MNDEIDRLFARLHALEGEIEHRLEGHRAGLRYRLARGRAVFDAEVAQFHRGLRTGVLRYLRETPWRHFLVAPVIYATVLPIVVLDLWLTLYQQVCFRAWGVRLVVRGEHVVLDRHRLGYLNAIEKLNCLYCGYANGVLAYAREIAGRTEQFWCPIRHATAVRGAHSRYREFVDYGDAEGYRARLEELRGKLR